MNHTHVSRISCSLPSDKLSLHTAKWRLTLLFKPNEDFFCGTVVHFQSIGGSP